MGKITTIVLWYALLVVTGCEEKKADGRTPDDGRRGERDKIVKNEIEPLVREGDIVFRRGGGLTSRAVLVADADGIYSHVGIIVASGGGIEKTGTREPGSCEGSERIRTEEPGHEGGEDEGTGAGMNYMVVHIVPGEPDTAGVRDVIKKEDLETFFAPDRASKGAVMRVSGDSVTKKENVVRVVADLGVVSRAARRAGRLATTGLMFDHGYDLDDTTRMYCTELVWRIFEREGLDLTEGRRTKINMPGFRGDYILPTDIARSPELELIYRF